MLAENRENVQRAHRVSKKWRRKIIINDVVDEKTELCLGKTADELNKRIDVRPPFKTAWLALREKRERSSQASHDDAK